MTTKLKPGILILSFLILVAIGVEISSVDRRVLWTEEVYGLTAAAGVSSFTEVEQRSRALVGRDSTAGEVGQLLRIDPQVPFTNVVKFLYQNDRHHFPLYYLVLKAYGNVFGDSTVVLRSLSLFFFLLCFPTLWWLTANLGFSERARVLSLLVFALSRNILFYGQMVREYGFWTFMIVLTHAVFFHAMRSRRHSAWGLYFVVLLAALYTNIFSLLILPVHFVVLFLRERKLRWSYVLSTGAALLLFAPFVYFVLMNFSEIRSVNDWAFPHDWAIKKYILWVLFEWGYSFWEIPYICAALLLLVVARQVLSARRHSPSREALLMMLIPLSAFLAYDLLKGGTLAKVGRYTLVATIPLCLLIALELDRLFTRIRPAVGRYALALALFLPSAQMLYHFSTDHFIPMMNHEEQTLAVDFMRIQPVQRIVSCETKSVPAWIGIARKMPPDLKWTVLSAENNNFAIPNERMLWLRLRKSFLRERGDEVQQRFTAQAKAADEYFWLLDPK